MEILGAGIQGVKGVLTKVFTNLTFNPPFIVSIPLSKSNPVLRINWTGDLAPLNFGMFSANLIRHMTGSLANDGQISKNSIHYPFIPCKLVESHFLGVKNDLLRRMDDIANSYFPSLMLHGWLHSGSFLSFQGATP